LASASRIEFGTDGIRGVAGEFPLDMLSVMQIGRAIGRWQLSGAERGHRVVIGADTRRSSQWMAHTLAGALLSEGLDVENVGVVSTPGVAHMVRAYQFGLGIMISASHNPADQNGIKLFGADGFKLDDDAEAALEALINDTPLNGTVRSHDLGVYTAQHTSHECYREHLVADLPAEALRGVRVVLDCAHGAAFRVAPQVFADRGAAVITLNAEPDGYNINRDAGSEHIRRDRAALHQRVVAEQADLGIAFDGDADRVVFVTPERMLIDGDHTLGLLALEMQAQGLLSGNTVVATEMSNTGLEDFLAQHHIHMSRTKVGDRYVMARLRERGFTLGGEQAGHIIVLDADHTCGDGIYAALKIALLVATSKRAGGPALTERALRIPRYPQVIASVHLSSRVELTTVPALVDLQAAALAAFGGKGRINMRFSGTEPNLLRTMIEGGPSTNLQTVVEQVMRLCEPVISATHTRQPKIDVVDCVTGAPVHLP
jgi:phosphoglucosamine mutase